MSYIQYSYNGKDFLEVYDNRRPSQMNQFSSPYKKRLQNSIFCFFSKNVNTNESSFTILGSVNLSDKEKSSTNTKIIISGLDSNCVDTSVGDCTTNRIANNDLSINVNGDDFSIFIEKVNDVSNISIEVQDNYNIKYFSIMNSDEDVYIEKLPVAKIINITKQNVTGYGVMLNPSSSALLGNRLIYPIIEDDVQSINYSHAYVEPQSFNVAVSVNNDPVIVYRNDIEGSGKLVVSSDSRFFNNSKWNSSWTTESQFSGNFKLFSNIIKYITDNSRINNGNKKILIYQNVQNTYFTSLVNTSTSGYSNSIVEFFNILGYTVERLLYTSLPVENIGTVPGTSGRSGSSRVLKYDIDKLNEYAAIMIMSNGEEFLPRTESPYISYGYMVDKIFYGSLKEYMRTGGGVFVTGSNYNSDNDTFSKASINQYDNLVYPADGASIAFSSSTDIHNLINTIITDYGIYVNGAVTTSDTVLVSDVISENGTNPLTQGIPISDTFEFLPRTSIINNEPRNLVSVSASPSFISVGKSTNVNYKFRRSDGTEGITKARYHKISTPLIRSNIQGIPSTLLYPDNSLNTVLRQKNISYLLTSDKIADYRTVGSIKVNDIDVADLFIFLNELNVIHRTSYGSDMLLNGGDKITIEFIEPFKYSHSFILNKRNIKSNKMMSVSDIYMLSNNEEASTESTTLNQVTEFIIQNINDSGITNKNNYVYDLEILKQYMSNQIRLPKSLSLIYDDNDEYDQAVSLVEAITAQDIFNTWSIFNISGSVSEFYENISVAPQNAPYTTWIYDPNTDSVVQTANIGSYSGFVSPEKVSSYVHEVTLTSTSGDDDGIGVCIAHFFDGTRNHNLDVIISNGGIGYQSVMTVVVDRNAPTNTIIDQSSHDITFKNSSANGTGWSNKRMRVRVERNGDNIKILATNWDSLTFNPASEIIIDLNSRPILEKFKGPMSYGYTTTSQSYSTYLDIYVEGGSNFDLVTNVNTNQNSVPIGGARVEKIIPMQVAHGYIKVVENPITNRKFFITEDDHYNYWGDVSTIEVVGKRKFIGQETFYIVNYDVDKTYSVVATASSVSVSGDEININVQSNTGEYTFTVSDGVNNIDVDVICLQSNQDSDVSTGSNTKPKIPRTVLNKRK